MTFDQQILFVISNKKINQNLFYYTDLYNISAYPLEYSIYKYYYAINNQIDYFFIDSDTISPEVDSFIKEFSKNVKFILNCFDIKDVDSVEKYQNYIYLAIGQQDIDHNLYKKYSSFIVNDRLYSNIDYKDIIKKEQMVYFLDNQIEIPSVLQEYLYPNGKLPIKLFNGSKAISHYQHLGYLDENYRKKILLDSKFYLFTNNDYVVEAQLTGCSCINIVNGLDAKNPIETIESYSTYNDLLKEIL